MTEVEVLRLLNEGVVDGDIAERSAEIVQKLLDGGADIQSLDVIFDFMEKRPSVHFGTPGHLATFMERFAGRGYEERLVESVRRRPTAQTVRLLNRLINGARTESQRREWLALLIATTKRPDLDPETAFLANDYREFQESGAQ